MLFSTKNLTRLLWILIIILAFVAGYFQSYIEVEKRKAQYLQKEVLRLENQVKEMKLELEL